MAQWNRFEGMEGLRRDVDRAFEDFGSKTSSPFRGAFLPGRGARQYPLINLHEDADTLYIEALAPGASADTLNVSVVRNTLTLSGEKQAAKDGEKSEAFHRNERAAGRFVRTVELPVEVDENNVKAEYNDGLILVTLPKAEKAKPKQITVQAL